MFTQEVQQHLDEIADLWNKVEGQLKKTERIRLEVVITAVNELRYGGRIAVDAIAIAGHPELDVAEKTRQLAQKLNEIRANCIRARADTTDALVLFFHKHLALNIEEFGMSAVITHFPHYTEMAAKIKEINEFMALSREDRLKRQDIYEKINDDHLPALEQLYYEMVSVSDELIEDLNEQRARDSRDTFFGKYGFVFGIVGCVLGALGIFLTLADALHFWPFRG